MTNSSNAKAVVRPLPVTAAVVAVLSGLAGIGLSFLGLLVGWGIGGTPGTVGDVLRSAVNLWLLSHRAGLRLDSELYTLAPLGLTIVWVWIAFRATRWAAATACNRSVSAMGRGWLAGKSLAANPLFSDRLKGCG
mgnify:CR=1 FL=1